LEAVLVFILACLHEKFIRFFYPVEKLVNVCFLSFPPGILIKN